MKELPSIDAIRSAVDYNKKTGKFTWKTRGEMSKSWNSKWAGKPAFDTLHPYGYRKGRFGRFELLAHRVAWAVSYGFWPEEEIDHIDRNPDNNKIENLRLATPSNNQWNKAKYKTNTSGYKGVTWSKDKGKWMARCSAFGKEKFLGYFDDAKSASEAYCAYSKDRHGDYHCA